MNEYITEIRLSRRLTRELSEYIQSLPEHIQKTYKELTSHYQEQMEEGIQ